MNVVEKLTYFYQISAHTVFVYFTLNTAELYVDQLNVIAVAGR